MDSTETSIWSMMSGTGLSARGQFASPWQDLSSRFTPRTLKDALWLSEFLFLNYGIYRKASERVVDYFLTEAKFSGQDDREREKFQKMMQFDFRVMSQLRDVGLDWACYGNAFCSLQLPFTRVLRCSKCNNERNIKKIEFQFKLHDLAFYAQCPKCKGMTRHFSQDYANKDAKKIHLVRWDPKSILIEQNRITGDTRYWLDIPPDIKSKVMQGDPFILATTPWPFIAAIKNNQRFLFDNNCFYHLKEHTVAGLNLNGWGIPSVLSAFKNFFRLQVLYRYDEVLKMDYIVPLRILSPAQMKLPAGNDFVQANLGNFTSQAQQAVMRHRVDGADWNFFPFPVNYQAIGGEGAQLDQSTRDSIQAEEDRLLNVRGVPPELYRNNMTLQAAPVALRLFERSNAPLIEGFNHLLQWMSDTVARYMNSGEYEVELSPVTITDNVEDKAWRLQAAMSGAISKETGFSALGISVKDEVNRVIQEQMDQQKAQQKAQQDQQMAEMTLDAQSGEQQGQQQQGGMTPGDVEAMGDEKARSLLDPTLPEQNRRQELAALRNSNPTLHAVVIKKMEQYRNQAGTAGQQAGLQQILDGQQ